MEKDGYDSLGSGFSERVEKEILRLENGRKKARAYSYIVIPDSGIWRRIGHRTFYRLYGLHYFSIGDDPRTAGIQRAIDTAKSRIFIKDGTYIVSARQPYTGNIYYSIGITLLKHGLVLEGETARKTVIQLSGGVQATVLLAAGTVTENLYDVIIKNMTIDGNRLNQTDSGIDGNQCGIFSNFTNGLRISDVIIKSCVRQGFYGSNDQFSNVRLRASDCGLEGVSISACSYGVYDVITETCGQKIPSISPVNSGTHLSGLSQKNLVICHNNGNKGNGFSALSDAGTNDCRDNYCIIFNYKNGYHGVQIGDPTASTFTDYNIFEIVSGYDCMTTGDGISIFNARRNKISAYVYNVQTGTGLHLQSGSLNNEIYLVTFDDQPVHTQTYALLSELGAFNRIIGGDVSAGGFVNGILSVATGSIIIENLRGYTPQGFAITTPAMPASGTAQSNTFPFPVIVYLYGGTVTQITVNGQVVFSSGTGISLTGQSFTLEPGDTIAISYSVAPTWKWYGL